MPKKALRDFPRGEAFICTVFNGEPVCKRAAWMSIRDSIMYVLSGKIETLRHDRRAERREESEKKTRGKDRKRRRGCFREVKNIRGVLLDAITQAITEDDER